MLDMTQEELARRAKITRVTLRQFEQGGERTRESTVELIQRALGQAGVEFIGTDAVRVRSADDRP
jgi:transcriptional regulator with XRE-family HTH domain